MKPVSTAVQCMEHIYNRVLIPDMRKHVIPIFFKKNILYIISRDVLYHVIIYINFILSINVLRKNR